MLIGLLEWARCEERSVMFDVDMFETAEGDLVLEEAIGNGSLTVFLWEPSSRIESFLGGVYTYAVECALFEGKTARLKFGFSSRLF